MFKRQFYAVDHADNDDASSSDSSVNTGSDDDSAHEQDDAVSSPDRAAPGSEDSDADGDGEPPESESEDDEWNTFRDRNVKAVQAIDSSYFLSKKQTSDAVDRIGKISEEEALPEGVEDRVVLRVGGVLKCRYCVDVVCLNHDTMAAHLVSKRHGRALKKNASGTLKIRLNSDGEQEEDGETHAERLERIRRIAEEEVVSKKKRKNCGRPRQRKRAKQKAAQAELAMKKSANQGSR